MVTEAEILKFVHSRKYSPMTVEELAARLDVPSSEREEFQRLVRELEFAGELVEVKKRRLADPERVDLVVGTLLCNPRGFGFLRPARERDGEDRYISGENMSSAMHGDLVVAGARRDHQASERKDVLGIVPGVELQEGVRAHDEEQLALRETRGHGRQRVPCVDEVALDLEARRDEADVVLHRQLGHREPGGGRCVAAAVLVRRRGRRDEEDAFEPETRARVGRYREMREVRRIERAAHDPYARERRGHRVRP